MRLLRSRTIKRNICLAALTLVVTAASASAQSTDVGRPTPVRSNEIGGRIAPRDVGDARLTRHFYAFTGLEGDLVVSVESTDFNGDVDVFTASSLRPLLKITTFGSSVPTRVTKGVYLRLGEPLILRVEGRAVAEADAQYRIRFEGAFGPASGSFAQAEESETTEPVSSETASANPTGRRTTATGARIPEPISETVSQPETTAGQPVVTPAETSPTPAEAEPARTRRGRGARNPSRANTRRTRPAPSEAAAAEADRKADAETSGANKSAEGRETPEASTTGETSAPRSARSNPPRRRGRGAARTRQAEEARPNENATGAGVDAGAQPSAAEPAPEPGPRLIIVTKDGEMYMREMRTVRRVTVERGQIVVVGTDGKVTRQPMSNVVRMAIEP